MNMIRFILDVIFETQKIRTEQFSQMRSRGISVYYWE